MNIGYGLSHIIRFEHQIQLVKNLNLNSQPPPNIGE